MAQHRNLKNYARLAPSAVALMTGLAASQGAWAAAASEATRVDEVVVTAQRRAEKLEDVPASVSVVNGDTLASSGIVRFQDLGQSVVGVQIARTGVFTQPAIRGVTTLISGGGYENNVGVYIDGFYQSDAVAINADLANIQDVEVLKGAQGTLYGRNATGGAILVNTLRPSDKLEGSVSAGYGRFNEKSVGFYVSGPIVDRVKGSIAGYWRKNDGYIRDVSGFDAAPFSTGTVRAKLEIDPIDDVTVTLGYNHLYLNDPRSATYVEYAQLPAGFTGTSLRDQSSVNFRTINLVKSDDYTILTEVKTPIGKLTSHTGYTEKTPYIIYDFDGDKQQKLAASGLSSQRTWQQGVDYSIDVIPKLDLVVGGFYYYDKYANRDGSGFAGGVRFTQTSLGITTEAYSGYIDGTYQVSDKLFVTAGGRYSHEEKTVAYRTTVGALANTLLTPRSASFKRFTPRFSVRYQITDETNIYASFSKGFKSGTYATAVGPPALEIPIKQESVNSYEVGVKTVGSNWRWSSAAYYYDYTNLQVSTTQIINGLLTQILGNAKSAEIYGVESEVTANLTDQFEVGAGIAYNHARYKDLKNAVGTGVNPTTGLNATAIQNWSGLSMVRAPDWTANVHGTYKTPMFGGETALTGSVAYSSKYIPNNPSTFETQTVPPNTNKAQRFYTKGYTLVNLQAAWTDPSEKFTVSVYGNNVFNDRYLLTNSGSTFGSYRQFNEPRTYGTRLKYAF